MQSISMLSLQYFQEKQLLFLRDNWSSHSFSFAQTLLTMKSKTEGGGASAAVLGMVASVASMASRRPFQVAAFTCLLFLSIVSLFVSLSISSCLFVSAPMKTTVVLMGYSPARYPNYNRILPAYASMTCVLDRVILIWNNNDPSAPPPTIPGNPRVPVIVHQAKENLMTNRYRLEGLVRTSSVVTVDDDVILRASLLAEMIKTHAQHQNQLVGLDARAYNQHGEYLFEKGSAEDVPLVIGKTILWPTVLSDVYFRDEALAEFTSKYPCEDIALCFVAKTYFGTDPIILPGVSSFRRRVLPEPGALSLPATDNWPQQRNHCVKWLVHHYSLKWVVLLTVNFGFMEFFDNWWLHYARLDLQGLEVVAVAEDERAYSYMHRHYPSVTVVHSQLNIGVASDYNSEFYLSLVSTRATHILNLLRQGKNVIYSDVDTVWLKDPRDFIFDFKDIGASSDATTRNDVYLCTGFMAIRANARSVALMETWEKELQTPQKNQPIFNKLLKSNRNAASFYSLPEKRFPNGHYFFDVYSEAQRKDAAVVHNNYIVGHVAKIERFKKHGLWLSRMHDLSKFAEKDDQKKTHGK